MYLYLSTYILQVVSLLLDSGFVDLKAKNLEGDTVFNILERQPQDEDNRLISDMLMRRERSSRRLTTLGHYLISPLKLMRRQHLVGHGIVNFFLILEKCCIGIRRLQTGITEERRNALLVVAALLITVTYQVALSPDKQPNQFNCTAPINATGANQYFNCTARFNASSSEVNSLISSPHGFEFVFLLSNTLAFFLTNAILFLLLPLDDLLGGELFAFLLFLSICYCSSTPLVKAPLFILVFSMVLLVSLFFFPCISFLYMYRRVKHFSSDRKLFIY
jgi:hypothetical protein